MILTSNQIFSQNLVHNRVAKGERPTTYDATVGEIIYEGRRVQGADFVLPSRGMVWVISRERFALPDDVTGLATLRTTWTHDGILALNVGIVDPGWDGPLATALVNFSKANFEVKKGEPFLRVLFHQHAASKTNRNVVDAQTYLSRIQDKSKSIPDTFLDLKKLADEMLGRLYGSAIFGGVLARIGLGVALLGIIAIFVPVAYGVSTEWMSRRADVKEIKADVEKMKNEIVELQKHQIIQAP